MNLLIWKYGLCQDKKHLTFLQMSCIIGLHSHGKRLIDIHNY